MPPSKPRRARSSVRRGYLAAPPLTRAGDAPEGHALLREAPEGASLALWGALRDVMLWVETPPSQRERLFAPGAEAARVAQLRACEMDAELRISLLSLAALSADPAGADAQQLRACCVQVARWAEANGAPATRLAFTQAAALLSPQDARLALEVGRMARDMGQPARAESWLRRTVKVARNRDWEAYVWAFMALGLMYWRAGNLRAAVSIANRALRKAHRHRIRALRGVALHNLFVFVSDHDARQAYEYAEGALRAYGDGHPRVPVLAQDVACYWSDQGQYARALPVINAALSRIADNNERALVTAGLARAAAGAGVRELYEKARGEALHLMAETPSESRRAETLVTLARADILSGERARAELIAQRAIETSTRQGEAFIRLAAEEELESARAGRCPQLGAAPAETPRVARRAELLQIELLSSLGATAKSGGVSH